MSYYGISVLITTVITLLVAFYLLYKAKELNLGILISISIGSVILGFSFSPAFNAILNLLSDKVNISRKLALIVALLTVLAIFLILIMALSLIIAICIPSKFTKIDCGIYIDRILERIKRSFLVFTGKIIPQFKNIVKNVYNIRNKLKKPVDTKQIIDTMGIEKNEISELESKIPENAEFTELLELVDSQAAAEIEKTAEAFETVASAGAITFAAHESEEPVTASVISDDVSPVIGNALTPETEQSEAAWIDEAAAHLDEETVYTAKPEDDAEMIDTGALEVAAAAGSEEVIEEETIDIADNAYSNLILDVSGMVDHAITEADTVSAGSLVSKAFESKGIGKKEEAIEYYMEALVHEPENEMIFWIVLDVCTLYKQLGLNDLAGSILEGIVSQYGSIIQPDMKEEIMKNLK